LLELCDLTEHANVKGKIKKVTSYLFGEEEIKTETLQKKLNCHFENRTIKIPPNLSIIASMNTSDSSIYYMDSAFKRRWEWEFIDVDSNTVSAEGVAFENRDEWIAFVGKLNAFIKSNHKSIRGIEDKQIGQRFINFEIEGEIKKSSIQNKLMFFLWDSVFNRDKKPLVKLLFDENTENELITFGDFAVLVREFIDKINNFKNV
jgi:5-methylcytosine-specific restriction endonuclease McrBC GTP-binding regulatory subunit McrB